MSPSASDVVLSASTRNPAVDRSPVPAVLPALAGEVCLLLYQHRVATTAQLHQLLTPDTADPTYLRRCLRAAVTAGLIAAAAAGSAQHRVWYLTGAGYAVVEASGGVEVRPHRMTPALVTGRSLAHRLAVVDVGTVFVSAARRRDGDVCTPWSWAPEVLLRPGRRGVGGALIADAVLYYEQVVDDGTAVEFHRWLIEVDRGTYPPARLAVKLAAYARWWTSTDRHAMYQHAGLLVVMATPPATAKRRLLALDYEVRLLPQLGSTRLRIGAVEYDQLAEAGPWANVMTDVLNPDGPLLSAALER